MQRTPSGNHVIYSLWRDNPLVSDDSLESIFEFRNLSVYLINNLLKVTNDATAEEIKRNGGTAYSYVCDLTKTDEIRSVADKVRREIGDPYILVNNAGILTGGELLKVKEAHIRRTFEINTLSHFWVWLSKLVGVDIS